MQEFDLGVLRGHLQDVRVEIAEAGREQQAGVIQLDHALHGLGDVIGLGDLFFLDDLHAGHFLQHNYLALYLYR